MAKVVGDAPTVHVVIGWVFILVSHICPVCLQFYSACKFHWFLSCPLNKFLLSLVREEKIFRGDFFFSRLYICLVSNFAPAQSDKESRPQQFHVGIVYKRKGTNNISRHISTICVPHFTYAAAVLFAIMSFFSSWSNRSDSSGVVFSQHFARVIAGPCVSRSGIQPDGLDRSSVPMVWFPEPLFSCRKSVMKPISVEYH